MMRLPVANLGFSDRFCFRLLAGLASFQIRAIHGLANILPGRDPFILALNHSTMREWATVPVLLMTLRGGRYIHFLADWNFRIVPGIGFMMRRGRVITIARKDAKPKFLTVFRRLYDNPVPAMERARNLLTAGSPIGIFPEGRINRDARRLLPGRNGAARLSIETGVPVVPVGIRFPAADQDKPIGENQPMEVHIGAALHPVRNADPKLADVRAWHAVIMTDIARLSGKSWTPRRLSRPGPRMATPVETAPEIDQEPEAGAPITGIIPGSP